MTLTAHSLIAAAIVSKVGNPVLGLPIILISHFVMDKVPHWDAMTNKNKTKWQISRDTLIDIILGFGTAAVFYHFMPGSNPVYFFSAILLSQAPDLLEAPYVFPQTNNIISTTVYDFQHVIHDIWFDSRLEAPWGLITQAVVVSGFLLWAFI